MWIVPGNLGCLLVVLARMAILAPSRAHLKAIESPIPREAPVMTIVLLESGFCGCLLLIYCWMSSNLFIFVWFMFMFIVFIVFVFGQYSYQSIIFSLWSDISDL